MPELRLFKRRWHMATGAGIAQGWMRAELQGALAAAPLAASRRRQLSNNVQLSVASSAPLITPLQTHCRS